MWWVCLLPGRPPIVWSLKGNHTFGRVSDWFLSCIRGWISRRQPRQMPWLLQPFPWCPLILASSDGSIMPFSPLALVPSLVNEWFYLSSARFLLVKTVQYSSQRRGTPNLHLLSHPLTLRRCNLSNESNCIVCRDAPLEFLNLPWCPSPVTGIAVVPSLTQTFPRQELQCPMTNEIRPLMYGSVFESYGKWNPTVK